MASNLSIKDTGGSRGGDRSRAADEIVSKLQRLGPNDGALVPAGNDFGYRALELEYRHKGGLSTNDAPAKDEPLPPSLLTALGDLDFESVLIPQTFSKVQDRNVRFGVLVPPGYDADKKYEVVALVPPKGNGFAVARDLSAFKARAKAVREKLGRDDLLFVCMERPADRAIDAKGATERDVMRWMSKGLGTSDEALKTFHYNEIRPGGSSSKSESSRDVDETSSSSRGGFLSWLLGDDEPAKKRSKKKSLANKLAQQPEHFVVSRDSREALKLTDERATEANAPFPTGEKLKKLANIDRPVAVVARADGVRGNDDQAYAVVLPPKFDPQRREPYAVKVVVPSSGSTLTQLASKLPGAIDGDENTVLVVPQVATRSAAAVDAATTMVNESILSDIQQSIPLDLTQCSTVRITKDEARWKSSIANDTKPHDVPGVMVLERSGWALSAKNAKPDRRLSAARGVDVERIPAALQKQAATEGTLFMPVMDSKSLNEPIRFGVYLPPGYDPSSKERYPVTLMLPGKGTRLNNWDNVGDLKSHLDGMMGGDGQKMIVVVAEGNDSFWYDYDKNGDGDFHHREGRTSAKRDYEGHMVELLDYAEKELEGDPKRTALYGISRGGFGALHMFARHDRFDAVFAHSADVGHETEGGELGRRERSLAHNQGHFGPAGDPVWTRFDPKVLAKDGKFANKGPIAIEIGAGDPYFVDDNVELSALLDESGAPHSLRVLESKGDGDKHNWAFWNGRLPSAIGFLQDAFGKSGKVEADKSLKDIGGDKRDARDRAIQKLETSVAERIGQLEADIPTAREMIASLADQPAEHRPRPYERFSDPAEAAPELERALDGIVSDLSELRDDMSLKKRDRVTGDLTERFSKLVDELGSVSDGGGRFYGELPVYAKGSAASLRALPKAAAESLRELVKIVPDVKAQVYALAENRPELFPGADRLTKKPFAEHLVDFAKNDLRDTDTERAGFGMYLDRMMRQEWHWRRDGYSNSVNAATSIPYQHPGVILEMISAARDDRRIKLTGVYDGDGKRSIPVMGDFQAGFGPVEKTWTQSKWGDLPAGRLGYERAFLRLVEDELRPRPDGMPKHMYFGQRCGPVAVAMSKLTGDEVYYGYASHIRSGEELKGMLELQAPYGVSMSNVNVKVRDDRTRMLHFPMFSDYDAETGTALLQAYAQRPQRVKLDEVKLSPAPTQKGDPGKEIGLYYRAADGMDAYLTPERQPNAEAIERHSGEKFDPGDVFKD